LLSAQYSILGTPTTGSKNGGARATGLVAAAAAGAVGAVGVMIAL